MESARDAAEWGEGLSGSWHWRAGPVQQGEKAGRWRARAAGLQGGGKSEGALGREGRRGARWRLAGPRWGEGAGRLGGGLGRQEGKEEEATWAAERGWAGFCVGFSFSFFYFLFFFSN